jgi:RimJ/RimL family protein N-acetyltransferase
VELSDGTVTLRRFDAGDVQRIVEGCSDPATVSFVPLLPVPYGPRDAQAYLRHVEELWALGERLPFAIADSATGLLLGAIDVRVGEVGSIGYWVHPDARGRGVATRALVLLSRWAVGPGGVERLELTTHPENLASQRVAERAGFVREGVLRSHLRFREGRRDSILFALLPADIRDA